MIYYDTEFVKKIASFVGKVTFISTFSTRKIIPHVWLAKTIFTNNNNNNVCVVNKSFRIKNLHDWSGQVNVDRPKLKLFEGPREKDGVRNVFTHLEACPK